MLIQSDAALIPFPDQTFHCVVTSPPYWGLRKYAGEQGRGMFPDLGLEPTPELHIEYMVEIMREVRRVLRDDGCVWLNYGDCYSAAGWECNRQSIIGSGSMNPEDRKSGKSPGFAAGNLMMMPHKVAIALQNDGWIVRNDVVWWKRNPMPESINGWRWEKHRIRKKSRGKSVAGIDKQEKIGAGNPHALRDGYEAEYVDCPGCEKCLHDNPLFPPLHVLRRGSWRHTRSHEYIFQLVKGPKMNYYSNQEAVRTKLKPYKVPKDSIPRDDLTDLMEGANYPSHKKRLLRRGRAAHAEMTNYAGANPRSVLDVPTDSMEAFYHWLGERMGIDLYEAIELFRQEVTNPNDVLDVPTSPYKGAHYATFPPNLIAPLVRASCPKRCCPECGAPWAPVVEKKQPPIEVRTKTSSPRDGMVNMGFDKGGIKYGSGQAVQDWINKNPPRVTDYRPNCSCEREDHIPGICLDPFIGSGTTGQVARELGRRWVGLDISMEYLDRQAKVRALKWTPSNALDDLPLFQSRGENENENTR